MSPGVFVLLCVVCIHQVHSSEERITGFSGQSVVLKSGAAGPWNLTKVQWSIYDNTTFIARLKDGEVTLYNFWRFQGRLDLDSKTGDLTIHNVTIEDSLTYNVLQISNGAQKQHKVNLSVQESLKAPEIQSQVQPLTDQQCRLTLKCTASGRNVNLSWTPDGEFSGLYFSGVPNTADTSLVLFASFRGNRDVTFNCTASSGQQRVTTPITVGCSEAQESKACTVCSSCTSSVIWAIVLTVAVALISACVCVKYKDKIKDACPESPRDFIQIIRKRTNNFSPGSSDVQGKKDVV